MRKRVAFVVAFACVHVIATVSVTIATMGAVMQGFDGSPVAPSRVASFLSAAGEVLFLPLTLVVRPTGSSLSQYAVLFSNGLLWGCAALYLIVTCRGWWSRTRWPATSVR